MKDGHASPASDNMDSTLVATVMKGSAHLVASSRTALNYSLGPESFMFGCAENGERDNCAQEFKPSVEPYKVEIVIM